MNDLVTRLLLDSKQFDGNLAKSTKEVKNFQQSISKQMQSAKNSIGGLISFAGKIAPAIGASLGAFEAFKKTIQSTETGLDNWERTVRVAQTSVDSLFISISNGSFSPLINGLENVVNAAKEAYDAIDALGTMQNFHSVEFAQLNAERERLKLGIAQGKKNGEDTSSLQEQLTAVSARETELMGEEIAASTKAVLASVKEIVVKETKGWYDEGIATDWMNWDKFETLTKEGLAEESRQIEAQKNRLGSQYDLAVVKYKEYKDLIDSGNASQKVQDAVKLVDAEREYQIKKAIFDQETQLVKVQQMQVQMNNKQASVYAKQRADLKQIEGTEKNITKEVQKQVKIKGDNSGLKNVLATVTLNGKSILSPEFEKSVDVLPTNISEKFENDFKKITQEQKNNKFLFNKGLISDEKFNSKNIELENQMLEKLDEIKNEIILNNGGNNQSAIATQILDAKVKDAYKAIDDNTILNGAVTKEEYVGNLKAKSNLEAIQNDLFNRYASIYSSDNVSDFAKSIQDSVLRVIESLSNILENANKEIERYEQTNDGIKAKLEDLNKQQVAIASVTNMVNRLGDAFDSAGMKAVSFVMDSLASVAQLTAEIANMCIINGVNSAAKLPYPYNIAAVTSTVATLSSIVGSAMQTFADGGIVQGNSTVGDKTLIRVNAGEMVLNKGQQSHLFEMLNSGIFQGNNSNVTVNGTLKASGKDLIAVISNTNNKYSKIR